MISIIIPIFNEEKNITILFSKIVDILNDVDFEIIFIDDGSKDNSLKEILLMSEKFTFVKYLSFSRNFGHQNALRAGYDFAKGDCIISMDGDGQHPPEYLPLLVKKWEEGYQIVNTIRIDDGSISFFKKTTSNLFYRVVNFLADIEIKKGSADFRLIDRSVCDVVSKLNENNLFIRGMISWLGYSSNNIYYNVEKRIGGKSKYSFSKMISLAIQGILGYSIKPLRLSTFIGSIVAFLSFFYGLYAIALKLYTNTSIPGWSSILLMVSFLGGLQLLMIGILGEYVGKLFIESKKRPNYIINKTNIK
jgi:glycosyltransferase involved in cell wall biosynthesis